MASWTSQVVSLHCACIVGTHFGFQACQKGHRAHRTGMNLCPGSFTLAGEMLPHSVEPTKIQQNINLF